MCTGLEIALIAGMTASAGGTVMGMQAQGQQAKAAGQAGAYNAAIGQMNADAVYDAAKVNADALFSQAARMRSTQTAQQASSGVVIGMGSAEQVVADTTNLANQDALVMLYQGIDGYMTSSEQGKLAAMAGYNNAKAANAAKWGTLLSGIGSIASSAGQYKALTTPKE